MRQKDPRAGAFRFRGRGRVWARARVGAGAFSLFFASWLSCFVLWSGPVVWACGLGLWSGLVVWACGLGLWSGLLAWACGLGLWSGLAVLACGLGLWSGPAVWACGLGFWPGPVAWAVWCIRATARTRSTPCPFPRVLLASDPPPFRPTAGPSCLTPTDAPQARRRGFMRPVCCPGSLSYLPPYNPPKHSILHRKSPRKFVQKNFPNSPVGGEWGNGFRPIDGPKKCRYHPGQAEVHRPPPSEPPQAARPRRPERGGEYDHANRKRTACATGPGG